MILEVAELKIKPGQSKDFVVAFSEAEKIISSASGYMSHELKKCIENENEYLLLVQWQTIEDHEVGFRKSLEYQRWKKLLHHFYEPFPQVKHYS